MFYCLSLMREPLPQGQRSESFPLMGYLKGLTSLGSKDVEDVIVRSQSRPVHGAGCYALDDFPS